MRDAIAKRNKLVTVQTPTETTTSGETSLSWSTLLREWAAIVPLTSREYSFASQRNADVTHKIIMPYRPGITSACRIVWNSRVFELAEPPRNIDEENHTLEFVVTEVVQ